MGVWFEDMRVLAPYWQITGSSINVNFDDRNAMIGKTLAERLNLSVGSKLTLSKNAVEKHEFTIKGIVEAGDATDNMLIVSLEFAQSWLDKEGLANNALLNVKNEQGNGLISLVILILATLCVNTTLIAIVGERAKEFALQKALGAKQSDIIKQISTEILIIALCAIVAGLILGYILAQLLGLTVFNSYIDMRLPVIPITIVLSLLVAFIAVIVPTKRALNIQTANVLKGE